MKTKNDKTNILAMLPFALIFTLALCLTPIMAKAQTPQCENDVSNFSELQNTIDAIYGFMLPDCTITVTANIDITNPLIIQSMTDATFTIRGVNPNITLTSGSDGYIFNVSANLILENINLNGGGVYIDGGTFTMNSGKISGNTAYYGGGVYVNGGTFAMNGGEISGNSADFGGGVFANGDATFTMTGGEISGNTANYNGGGIYEIGGTFTMNGGEISGNSARSGGGVLAASDATFTMTGGEISGNSANYYGGGVLAASDATFTMTGGEISGNSADYAGGVYVNGGTFTMNGEEISGNTANYYGGGVLVDGNSSTFTMTGGEISGNSANYGGGVYIDDGPFTMNGGTITMTGGEISGNTANYYGGGVLVAGNNSTFTMTGGEITGNTVIGNLYDGGGVIVFSGTFIMNGGEITGNSATRYGGGVFLGNGTFTMTGGEISGNSADLNGGGVYVSVGTFTMTGGEISGNTTKYTGGGVLVNDGTFTMSGGEITGNTAANGGGGLYSIGDSQFTLGGDAVISGNSRTINGSASNVLLYTDNFITLGTGANAPKSGMDVWVTKIYDNGVIVNSGASAAIASYFHADAPGMDVKYSNNRLYIASSGQFWDFLQPILSYEYAPVNTTITVDQNMTLTSPVTIPANRNGRTLTIKGANPDIILTRAFAEGDMFTVNSGAKLILENITLDGDKGTYSDNLGWSLVQVNGGEFTMNSGVFLKNHSGGPVVMVSGWGLFTMNGGEISDNSTGYGAAVSLLSSSFPDNNGGIFIMNGGKITGNTASYNYAGWLYGGQGGGVYVQGTSTFTMNGGEISGNTVYGIEDNGSYLHGTGGGVSVRSINAGALGYHVGVFTMNGGIITGNTADNGGGVYADYGSEITLGREAIIRGNINDNVYLEGGQYIEIGTGVNAPKSGMDVWVTKSVDGGVIVNSGASAAIASYFHADEPGRAIEHSGGKLIIVTAPTYAATVSSAGSGATGGGSYAAGATVSIGAGTPPSGQKFKNWTTSSAGVTFADASSANTTFTMPANAVTVTAVFETITVVTPTYALNVLSGAGGTVSGTGSGSYAQGHSVSVTANQSSGYSFTGWTISGATITGGNTANPATFTMPSNAVTLTANFVLVSGTIIPVTNITGVPSIVTAGSPLLLTGTINPTTATNKTIVWSVVDNGMTGAKITGNTLNSTSAGYITVRATIANGLAPGVDYKKDFYITVNAALKPALTGIMGFSMTPFVDTYDVENLGDGNFSVTFYGDDDLLTIQSVNYLVENVPSGATIEYEIEKDGVIVPLDIYCLAALPGDKEEYAGTGDVTFNHGDTGIFKLWLDDVLVGAFTVVYVNEGKAEVVEVDIVVVDGASYFAPVNLPALEYGYRYEIVSRPNTVGGTAPRINAAGQFVINQQAMPLNISRAGYYVVLAMDGAGNVANVYVIAVY